MKGHTQAPLLACVRELPAVPGALCSVLPTLLCDRTFPSRGLSFYVCKGRFRLLAYLQDAFPALTLWK